MTDNEKRLPPGHQPYDILSGLRVGAAAGGILGAIGMVITGIGSLWIMLIGAAIGGTAGVFYQRRKLHEANRP